MVIPMWMIINLIQDQGRCDRDCNFPDKGPDCEPCTDDDILNFKIIDNPLWLTTGTGSTRFNNANRQGETLEISTTGLPMDCDAMIAEADSEFFDMQGGSVTTTVSLIDPPPVGDGSASVTLSCVPPGAN
jgi:hypothetical protein